MYKIRVAKKILFIILLSIFFISNHLYSQEEYKRKISISEWIQEMENCNEKEYRIKDTEIYFDNVKDSLYLWSQPRTEPTEKDKKQEKNIYPQIIIENCKLPSNRSCQIRNLVFHNNVIFTKCKAAGQITIYNCTFKQGLDLHRSELSLLYFLYSSIEMRTLIYELKINTLSFTNCSLYTNHKFPKTLYNYGVEKENHTYQYLFFVEQNEKKINKFYLRNCKVLPTEVMPTIYFAGGKYDVLEFRGINFSNSIVNFYNCSVKESFAVYDCKFKQPLGINQFNFPKDNTAFNWNMLDSVGLGLYFDYEKAPFTNKTDSLISNIDIFNELNSSYRKFFTTYKTRGDMESANACYTQMKDMETAKFRYLYKQGPSVKTWFNWRFNQFLKSFSEYGTSPVQSLIISMWAILVFAGVYFFFYTDWDSINRTFLIKQHRKILQYFRSEQRLEDFYAENYTEDFITFAEYKKEMKESKGEIPVFIILLGKPLYLLSIFRHKIITFIYRRTEILQGRWMNLKPARKVFVAVIVSVSILFYIIYLGFIRAINSTTLSINAFSTLGFGAIPVKGVSRYITILEGFLGWFLLSIFSVSLISQMLQN